MPPPGEITGRRFLCAPTAFLGCAPRQTDTRDLECRANRRVRPLLRR